MSRLIDADALNAAMYHEAFETDTDMQKWDSGCWIRYKMFERAIKAAPTIDAIPVKEFCEWLEECRCNIFKEALVINVQLFRAAMEKGEKNERD